MEVQKLIGDECYCGNCQRPLPGIVPPEPVQQVLPGIPCATPSEQRFVPSGKQVLLDGVHYGDMIDENAAKWAADALNAAEFSVGWIHLIAQAR